MINLMILDCVLDEITEHASGHMLSPKYAEPCWRPATAEDGNLEAATTVVRIATSNTNLPVEVASAIAESVIDAYLGTATYPKPLVGGE